MALGILILAIPIGKKVWQMLVKMQRIEKFACITLFYNETKQERINEYITCLERNLAQDSIETIHVLYDTSNDDNENKLLNYLKNKNIKISYQIGRATFRDCFEIANKYYPNRKAIIACADIFFNDTLKLLEKYDLTNKLIALTRWDVQEDGSIKPYIRDGKPAIDSQDVWIFKTPMRRFENDDLAIGLMGDDNRLAYWADKAGLHVFNPCKTIQCCHLHLSGIRNYDRNDRPKTKKFKRLEWQTL